MEPLSKAGMGATASVCAVAVAAGAVALALKRPVVQRAAAAVEKAAPGPVIRERFRRWSSPTDKKPEMHIFLVEPCSVAPDSEKSFATMIGADVETNSEPWDPMGFHKLFDRNFDFNNVMTYPHVQWLREAEIKHGRVCMLAFVGMVVQQWAHIPGLPVEPDWTKALDACYADKVAAIGVVQISVFAMLVEGKYSPHLSWIGQMDREPGDLGFDPLKLTKKPGFDLKKKQLSELKNGRLAMIGVASMAANHAIPGSVPLLTGAFAVSTDQGAARPSTTNKFCGQTLPATLAMVE